MISQDRKYTVVVEPSLPRSHLGYPGGWLSFTRAEAEGGREGEREVRGRKEGRERGAQQWVRTRERKMSATGKVIRGPEAKAEEGGLGARLRQGSEFSRSLLSP